MGSFPSAPISETKKYCFHDSPGYCSDNCYISPMFTGSVKYCNHPPYNPCYSSCSVHPNSRNITPAHNVSFGSFTATRKVIRRYIKRNQPNVCSPV